MTAVACNPKIAGKIIEFPEGLAGFETCRRFSLFHPEKTEPKYFILQSLDNPELAFQLVDPAQLGFSYEIALTDAESALLARLVRCGRRAYPRS